jgi:hypothetical protein
MPPFGRMVESLQTLIVTRQGIGLVLATVILMDAPMTTRVLTLAQ